MGDALCYYGFHFDPNNDVPSKPIHMQRGLRQGDPLSPFLFNLCMESFNRLYGKVVEKGHVEGLMVGQEGVRLTHLQFGKDQGDE